MGVLLKPDHKVRDIRITFGFFAGIMSLYAYRHYPSVLSYIFIATSFLLLLFVLFSPLRLTFLFEQWMKLSHLLAKVNTTILLVFLFVLIFIPTGLLKRAFGKDAMQRGLRSGGSYWETYELVGLKDKSRYEKQF